MHFLPRRRPLELTAQRVRALRPSLNTPVVSAAELPVGPACAAILVHVEPGHGLQISVGVRTLACGSVAIYGFDSPISASVVGAALDAALSFAESMGFLFDDDVVGDDAASREKAALRWQEMIGDGVPRVVPMAPETDGDALFDADSGELTDPPAEDESGSGSGEDRSGFELGDSSAAPAAASFRAETPPAPGVPLSKFRVGPEGEAPAAAPAGAQKRRAPLGRMRLVKRRPGEPVQDARRAWLLRLLTSF
jgi:hypothetical protein